MEDRWCSLTRKVKRVGSTSVGVYMKSAFGKPQAGDVLDIEVYDVRIPEVVYSSTKKVCKRGTSCYITLDKDWDFMLDDQVTIKYKFLVRAKPEECDDDDA